MELPSILPTLHGKVRIHLHLSLSFYTVKSSWKLTIDRIMYIINHAAVVTYLFGFAASTTTKICPILGPSFPKPSGIGSFSAFTGATKALDAAIDAALQSGEAAYGPAPFNTSTFSIGVLSAGDDGLSYQRHFTDPIVANSSVGVNHADANTVYRIGSASKAFTVLTFLSKIGYRRWYDPITLYLPKELFVPNERDNLSTGALPQWSDITVGDLASQISGLLRDCKYGFGAECDIDAKCT